MAARILITEDDLILREGLCALLTQEGYHVRTAADLRSAKALLTQERFDLILLDQRLPDGVGTDLCRTLRSEGVDTPVLFLTACDEETDVVRGLDAGADDYVAKPFRSQELLSRIRALLRRTNFAIYAENGIYADLNSMTVRRDGSPLFLTPTEFQILAALLRSAGMIVPRETLLHRIWDCGGEFIEDNTLSVHVSRLREKIGAAHIVTVRGVGYRWEK
ncbi:MAG: response regulator transcription factor [Clostridia bacterium]|nr:response regulator transcription factor [Clostridia bacterium]